MPLTYTVTSCSKYSLLCGMVCLLSGVTAPDGYLLMKVKHSSMEQIPAIKMIVRLPSIA